MAQTTSIAFPTMFDVARNSVTVKEDNESVVNRTRLLILSDPTELYNDPEFGVGLRRYIWQYNTDNTRAIIQDRIIDQLREREPCVLAEDTQFSRELLSDEYRDLPDSPNRFKMTVGLKTIFGDNITVDLNDDSLQEQIDKVNKAYPNLL